MSTKHFINDAEILVLDCLEGLTLVDPELTFDRVNKAIFHSPHNPSTHVTLIAGGGAGHEPAHAAYVGRGLLSAAVSGSIFASPSVAQILQTIVRAGGAAGVILIIKNYTGDIFHFNLAAEKARAVYGIEVKVIVVGDDVSVGRKKGRKVGRRGLAGTVLVHKVLGALTQNSGKSLKEIHEIGTSVAENLVTLGVSLGHVHIPGRLVRAQTLQEDELEVGMGIHNEPGCQIINPRPNLDSLLDTMLGQLLNANDTDRGFLDFADAEKVILLVNNLGGLSVLEMTAITKCVHMKLRQHCIKPDRVFSGTFMTSLDGPGFSVTLLKTTAEILTYIDAPAVAPGWPSAFDPELWDDQRVREVIHGVAPPQTLPPSQGQLKRRSLFLHVLDDDSLLQMNLLTFVRGLVDVEPFKNAVSSACQNIISSEPQITQFDTVVGDGDCGVTLARGAKAVRDFLSSPAVSSDALETVLHLAEVLENNMDGTSGALYAIFFNALATSLRDISLSSSEQRVVSVKLWGLAAKSALETLKKITPARAGDRTLMDALEPFVEGLNGGDLASAIQAAWKGAETTKGMQAAFGRAVYVEESAWTKVPDPGAVGVVSLVSGLLNQS